MKKIFGILAAVAMVAACNTSCSKSDDNGGGNGGGNTANVRIATWADDWDTYAYTFDAEGKVIKVSRNNGANGTSPTRVTRLRPRVIRPSPSRSVPTDMLRSTRTNGIRSPTRTTTTAM